jgi:hypothetical protein
MTVSLALEYIPRRMDELGHGRNYYIRFRHLILQPSETVRIEAPNQFYILLEEPMDVSINSDFGLYDLSNEKTNEQFYEHQGSISTKNYSATVNHLRFIQVIPKTKKYKKKK